MRISAAGAVGGDVMPEPAIHETLIRDEDVVGASDRTFGVTLAVIGVAVGALKLWRGHSSGWSWLAAATVPLLLALFWTAALAPFNRLWLARPCALQGGQSDRDGVSVLCDRGADWVGYAGARQGPATVDAQPKVGQLLDCSRATRASSRYNETPVLTQRTDVICARNLVLHAGSKEILAAAHYSDDGRLWWLGCAVQRIDHRSVHLHPVLG